MTDKETEKKKGSGKKRDCSWTDCLAAFFGMSQVFCRVEENNISETSTNQEQHANECEYYDEYEDECYLDDTLDIDMF